MKHKCLSQSVRLEFRTKQKNGHPIEILMVLYGEIIRQAKLCDCGRKMCQVYCSPSITKSFRKGLFDALGKIK